MDWEFPQTMVISAVPKLLCIPLHETVIRSAKIILRGELLMENLFVIRHTCVVHLSETYSRIELGYTLLIQQ